MAGLSQRLRLLARAWVLTCVLTLAPSAWAQADQLIYADSLTNGWQNWSWATVNAANTSPVHSGTSSFSVSATAWQAISLHHAAFATAPYTELVFWIHGGSTGGQLLNVQALLGGSPQAPVALPALAANTWQKITIPLGSLGVADKPNMDGFWIQDRSGAPTPTFYVDDISFTAVPPPAVVNVTVDATHAIRTIDTRHFGLNAAVWDAAFDTPTTMALLTEMGNRTLRFPGGSLSNDYHWQTNTTGTNTWTWATSFDAFAHVATATAANVFISVNYGSGTATEAAEWVRYANVTKGYGVKYWEIGNENYGGWETDQNVRPHDPYTYATRFKDYHDRMKAVDPAIKIGAVAITGEDSYANYTDHPATNPRTGQPHNGWTPVMLTTLKSLGVTPDFLIHHRYAQGPGAESDSGLLASSSGWSADAADLRRQLGDYLGAAGAGVELVATENNSVYTAPGKQTTSLVNGLFLADSIGEAMKTEFNGVVWWDLRNAQEAGNNNASSLYGWRLYGDYGIVTDATPAGPADRYPTFYVAKLLRHFVRGGDRLLSASSDYGLLTVHAARRADDTLTLLVINKSPTAALDASITFTGYAPHGTFSAHAYGIPQDEAARTGVGSADITTSHGTVVGSSLALTFPAYSATVISLNGAAPLVWRNASSGAVALWLMSGGTIASTLGLGTVPLDWTIAAIGDFDGDGQADILWRNTSSGVVAIWLMNGGTVTGTAGLGAIGLDWAIAGIGDFNGDGKADILWRNSSSGVVATWLMNGGTVTSTSGLGVVALDWTIAKIGDFDGDGKADILWRNSSSGVVAIWLMNGGTVASTAGLGAVALAWTVAAASDFDGDGKADILWRNSSSGVVALWLMNGGTVTSTAGLGAVAPGWIIAKAGDYSGDGKADILWRNTSSGNVALWVMNGGTVTATLGLGTVDPGWSPQ